ncbi:hypothetical protein SAMN05192532_103183 [Alteribacillus iranensis]|uniref:Bacterial Ig-like domain-containing protein n=1 Tax=Alteribacillus iranensis TaxID=930128 RepID=A0A1I2CSV8_9BACI|nr:hypothetical protein SAMN05192532_103183 [Alteribacillus iranensis]
MIVLPRLFACLLLFVLVALSGCQQEPEIKTIPDPAPEQTKSQQEQGIEIQLQKDVYNGIPDRMRVILNNKSDREYTYGEFYQLERKIKEKWHIVVYSDAVFYENPSFKNYGSSFLPGETVTQSYSPKKLGLDIPPGEYRLVKTFLHESPSYQVTVAVPFRVE